MVTPTPRRLGQTAIEGAEQQEGDKIFWSVTTIIGVLHKEGLLYWSGEMAALAAIHSERTWRGMLADDDPDCSHASADDCAVIKWLRDARLRRPKGLRSAAQLGSDVHAACESYALTGTRPEVDDEVRPYLERFDEWLQQFQPKYLATEVAVYHPEYGYAGTADAFWEIDGVRMIGDYKSSRKSVDSYGKVRKPYPEQVALQLAAYRYAKYAAVWRPRRFEKFRRRYYLFSPQEQAMAQPVPEVDTGLCLHITPEHCDAYPIICDENVFDAYLAAQDTARWLFQDSLNVMGDPLVPDLSRRAIGS